MSAAPELIPAGELSLPELADRINGHATDLRGTLRTSIEQAWHAGAYLHEAKLKLGHGKFQAWCEAELDVGPTQRKKWMKLAKGPLKGLLESPTTIDKALGYVSAARDKMDVHHSSESPEHCTPDIVLEHVIRALGDIDLDPCADPDHNVPAKKHYTIIDDGLAKEWGGRVFMNPPYGKPIKAWSEKLFAEFDAERVHAAIALIPSRTDTEWFALYRDCPICFVSGRLTFKGNDDPAPFPSAVAYLGPDNKRFVKEFSALGDVWSRAR